MRTVIQRVTEARVDVNGQTVGQIGPGVLILQSIAPTDTPATVDRFVEKLLKLAIFANGEGKLVTTIQEVHGSILLVSQFTLHADFSKGKTPSFSSAARPDQARPLYELTRDQLATRGLQIATGQFGAQMQVTLTNDGPVTLLLDIND